MCWQTDTQFTVTLKRELGEVEQGNGKFCLIKRSKDKNLTGPKRSNTQVEFESILKDTPDTLDSKKKKKNHNWIPKTH